MVPERASPNADLSIDAILPSLIGAGSTGVAQVSGLRVVAAPGVPGLPLRR